MMTSTLGLRFLPPSYDMLVTVARDRDNGTGSEDVLVVLIIYT